MLRIRIIVIIIIVIIYLLFPYSRIGRREGKSSANLAKATTSSSSVTHTLKQAFKRQAAQTPTSKHTKDLTAALSYVIGTISNSSAGQPDTASLYSTSTQTGNYHHTAQKPSSSQKIIHHKTSEIFLGYVLEGWGINKQDPCCVTTDNAAYMVSANSSQSVPHQLPKEERDI